MSTADTTDLRYCANPYAYTRRKTREVMVGNVGIGGDNPIRIQSMITSDTRDTEACVNEVLQLAEAGCEIVRITAQTKKFAENLENIAREVRAAGCEVPLVADIHFKPDAAMEAAKWVEKIRVNPGNFLDKKKFEVREYSDDQYDEELQRIRDGFAPLVEFCIEKGRAMRIGTNHGSLSDRIMNRYGDTPLGMVESALEFARIAREMNYHNFVFSMKASNPKVMIEAYRLLIARLDAEGPDWNYPIHLGVTEAGDGEDGRIKSAIGIGSLLEDGIGDTIRVSLTEDAIYEVPVARLITKPYREGVAGASRASASSAHLAPILEPNSPENLASLPEDNQSFDYDWSTVRRATSTYLPHWEVPGGIYSLSFHLADSIPRSVLADYRRQRELIISQIEQIEKEKGSRSSVESTAHLYTELDSLHSRVMEKALHEGHGENFLKDAEARDIVETALQHFDGERYDLHAWSVMPNHVHAIVRPKEGYSLADISHSWKSFTAKQINKLRGFEGSIWQSETYDRLIRSAAEYRRQVRYVLNNPGEAGAAGTGSVYGATWGEASGEGARCASDRLAQDAPATGTADWAVPALSYNPFSYEKRASETITVDGVKVGGGETVAVFTSQEKWNALAHKIAKLGDFKPEVVIERSGVRAIDPRLTADLEAINNADHAQLVTVADGLALPVVAAFRLLAARLDARHPILLKDTLEPSDDPEKDFTETLITAAKHIGSLLCDGIGDAVIVQGEHAPGQSLRLAYNILQASGTRIFKTDYVACPSCGRTLFNLQETTQKIRAATGHLKGVRIAVMGCIVNGPGEMADADFGYVGGAPNKINLYVGKQPVQVNIPQAEAVDRLIDLIKEHGKWIDAPVAVAD